MKNRYIDSDEQSIMESLDNINLKELQNDTSNAALLQKSAKEFVQRQESKMNIRISSHELEKIKERAAKEGLKYQTFVKSILHKYMTGQLVEKTLI